MSVCVCVWVGGCVRPPSPVPHLLFLAGGGLQGHAGGHDAVPQLVLGRGGLPLGGAGGDVPVVGPRGVPHPHPARGQVRVRLEGVGLPEGIWEDRGDAEAALHCTISYIIHLYHKTH